MIRSPLRFADQAIPTPAPIRTWQNLWDHLDSLPSRASRPVPRPTGHNPTARAYARVDDGRWIADCPWQCGSAFNLPAEATWFWCTQCAAAGSGHTAALIWPEHMEQLTANLQSLPTALQFWPCLPCRPLHAAGQPLCPACQNLLGLPAQRGT
ncbi:hypothetical protein ACFWYW_14635 [Nonomuraea sp. NPDC059023]|uniref:hypothetical protein n=1 Tax=unclassified Nonomuraea TaxID=2593643 RepID=UPI0036AC05CE